MRAIASATWLILLVALGGCQVVTNEPLFEPDLAVDEPALAGKWEEADNTGNFLLFESTKEKGVYTLAADPTDDFLSSLGTVNLFRAGTYTFGEVYLPEEKRHAFVRYEVAGDRLLLFTPQADWFKLQSEALTLVEEGGSGGSVVLTSPPEAVREFLAENATNSEAWHEARYVRNRE